MKRTKQYQEKWSDNTNIFKNLVMRYILWESIMIRGLLQYENSAEC